MKKSPVPATIFIFLLDFLKASIGPVDNIICIKLMTELIVFIEV